MTPGLDSRHRSLLEAVCEKTVQSLTGLDEWYEVHATPFTSKPGRLSDGGW